MSREACRSSGAGATLPWKGQMDTQQSREWLLSRLPQGTRCAPPRKLESGHHLPCPAIPSAGPRPVAPVGGLVTGPESQKE